MPGMSRGESVRPPRSPPDSVQKTISEKAKRPAMMISTFRASMPADGFSDAVLQVAVKLAAATLRCAVELGEPSDRREGGYLAIPKS